MKEKFKKIKGFLIAIISLLLFGLIISFGFNLGNVITDKIFNNTSSFENNVQEVNKNYVIERKNLEEEKEENKAEYNDSGSVNYCEDNPEDNSSIWWSKLF